MFDQTDDSSFSRVVRKGLFVHTICKFVDIQTLFHAPLPSLNQNCFHALIITPACESWYTQFRGMQIYLYYSILRIEVFVSMIMHKKQLHFEHLGCNHDFENKLTAWTL